MGVVYKGERVQLGRAVAVKFLHPWIAAQKTFLSRFENEAKAMSRLLHPHCVSVIDFGVEGSPYLVMDFVTGRTLRDVMLDVRLAPGRTMRLAQQLLADGAGPLYVPAARGDLRAAALRALGALDAHGAGR